MRDKLMKPVLLCLITMWILLHPVLECIMFFLTTPIPRALDRSVWTSTLDITYVTWASLVAQLVKNLSAMQETWVWSLGWEDSWREKRLPNPIFWSGEFHGVAESDTTEWLSLSLSEKRKWNTRVWIAINNGWVARWRCRQRLYHVGYGRHGKSCGFYSVCCQIILSAFSREISLSDRILERQPSVVYSKGHKRSST